MFNYLNSLYRLARRQSPWLIAIVLILAFLPLQSLFSFFIEAAFGAAPVVLGGPDLSPAQEAAAREARWVPLGIIVSKLGAAVFYFFIGVGLVWFTMGRIVPALPTWAKLDFTLSYFNLPVQWKFGVYVAIWLGLLYFFAHCLASASLVQ